MKSLYSGFLKFCFCCLDRCKLNELWYKFGVCNLYFCDLMLNGLKVELISTCVKLKKYLLYKVIIFLKVVLNYLICKMDYYLVIRSGLNFNMCI